MKIGRYRGTPAARVAGELQRFEEILQAAVAQLDRVLPVGRNLNVDEYGAVIDLCAWAHAEWVRIHPFANGNGRTVVGELSRNSLWIASVYSAASQT